MSNLSHSYLGDLGQDQVDHIYATAHAMADAARAVILPYFRAAFETDNKDAGGFDPVTTADRAAEEAMRAVLAQMRPEDGIIGEEFGTKSGTSGYDWILDPIDGTRAFICGAPSWGVLIALSHNGHPIYGIIDQPYIGERFEGGLGRASYAGPQGTRALSTRSTRPLAQATLMSTFPEVGTPLERRAFEALSAQVQLTRYGMDCYAYALLAAGQIDYVVEAGLNSYDIAAPIAVIEAAGGVVTNWQGGSAAQGGQVIAAANEEMLEQALRVITPVLEG